METKLTHTNFKSADPSVKDVDDIIDRVGELFSERERVVRAKYLNPNDLNLVKPSLIDRLYHISNDENELHIIGRYHARDSPTYFELRKFKIDPTSLAATFFRERLYYIQIKHSDVLFLAEANVNLFLMKIQNLKKEELDNIYEFLFNEDGIRVDKEYIQKYRLLDFKSADPSIKNINDIIITGELHFFNVQYDKKQDFYVDPFFIDRVYHINLNNEHIIGRCYDIRNNFPIPIYFELYGSFSLFEKEIHSFLDKLYIHNYVKKQISSLDHFEIYTSSEEEKEVKCLL